MFNHGPDFAAAADLGRRSTNCMHPLETLVDRFRAALRRPDAAVVLAVSGGADSVALLRAWRATDQAGRGRTVVAHYDHGWRGAESREDGQFVARLAGECGYAAETGYAPMQPPAVADSADAETAAPRPRGGPEAFARRQRYDFLTQVARRHGARYVATAHTAEDQAETVLLRILRGAGVNGLAGIPRFRRAGEAVTIMRPLLEAGRAECRDYLTAIGQSFREDPSNADLRFARNRVRHGLLPLLRREFNPDVDRALRRLADSARETRQAVAAQVDAMLAETVATCVGGATLAAAPLQRLAPFARRQLLVELWTRLDWPAADMNRRRWHELSELSAAAASGATFTAPRMFPGGVQVSAAAGRLRLVRVPR